jgi:transcriptional antiterminator NusG
MKWYAMHVMTGEELTVKNCLTRNGFPTLVPRRKLKEKKGAVWNEVEKTLLPGYVFVSTDMDVNTYYKLSATTGVINILRGGSDYPQPIPEEEMHTIFRLTRESDLVGISDLFMDGESVKVVSGPLQGFEGNIRKVDRRRFRAKVSFTFAGQEKVVELGVNVLDKT